MNYQALASDALYFFFYFTLFHIFCLYMTFEIFLNKYYITYKYKIGLDKQKGKPHFPVCSCNTLTFLVLTFVFLTFLNSYFILFCLVIELLIWTYIMLFLHRCTRGLRHWISQTTTFQQCTELIFTRVMCPLLWTTVVKPSVFLPIPVMT